ncbi:MAG: ATP-binding protein [Thermoleophilaceae bacterium]|nr:ATP-binding protein [Thermoleophilaceae bacterium]
MNPFVYSHPVPPADLVDREEETAALVGLAEGGHAARLSAPRRYGKTSLLRKVKEDAEHAGMACVYVDLTRVVSLADVADVIEESYRRSLQGPLRRAAVLAIRSVSNVAVRPGGVGVELSGGAAKDAAARRLRQVLDLPLRVHGATGTRTLVIFDEFQELLRAGEDLDGLLRSRIQHHTTEASYLYAGSHPGLMQQLFATEERPLFGQARPIALTPLRDEDLGAFVAERFEATGRDAGEALERLLDVAGGHPQRAMMLAHHTWERTEPGGTADAAIFAAALGVAQAEARDALQALWDRLPHSERVVLSTVAAGRPPLNARALELAEVGKTTARVARDRLIAAGVLADRDGAIAFTDPLLPYFVGGLDRVED